MLKRWQTMLEELKKQSRGPAILSRMESTLNQMKGELCKCQKL